LNCETLKGLNRPPLAIPGSQSRLKLRRMILAHSKNVLGGVPMISARWMFYAGWPIAAAQASSSIFGATAGR
jgi:hypothetical protein